MRARGLSMDENLRINERLRPLRGQFGSAESRDESWFWLMEHYDALASSLSAGQLASLPRIASAFCDAASAEQLQDFFGERVGELPSGSRNLESAVLSIQICAALREAQAESLAEWSGS